MEADGCEVIGGGEQVRLGRGVGEEVVEDELLHGGDVFDRCGFVVAASEIDVLRYAGGSLEPKLERQRAFDYPAIRSDDDETAKEELEGDAFTQPLEREACGRRFSLEPVVERLAERRGGRVPHRSAPAARAISIARCLCRREASSLSWRVVSSPRRSAC